MTLEPLKRHPALQPLSRDHFTGLLLAQQLIRAASDSSREVRREAVLALSRAWTEEIEDHFRQEERLLTALMNPEHLEHLRCDHAELRRFAHEADRSQKAQEIDPDWTRRVGQRLRDPIRWEERELFPAIEATASEEVLRSIARDTRQMESRRPRRVSRDS